jgi:hypothetical protein
MQVSQFIQGETRRDPNESSRPEAAQQPPRDQAVAFLRRCLHFEPADDGGGSERSPRPWS